MQKIQVPPRLSSRLLRPVCFSCLAKRRRSYHSTSYPDPPPFPAAETAILSAALHHVPRYGFTTTSLALGARDAGYLDVSVQLFPNGAFDLINYYLVTQRLALKDRLHFPEEAKLGLAAKVRALAWARLQANRDIIHEWQGVGPPIFVDFLQL
jgi:ubiquinone biosynthesis protein COQ9